MLHRDDIPFEEIERIEAMLKEHHPDEDFRLVFPGDMPPGSVPKEVVAAIAEMEKKEDESVDLGLCIACGDLIPDYRPGDDGWEMPDGWICLIDEANRIHGWRCPECSGVSVDDEGVDPDERWTTTDTEWSGEDGLEGDFE